MVHKTESSVVYVSHFLLNNFLRLFFSLFSVHSQFLTVFLFLVRLVLLFFLFFALRNTSCILQNISLVHSNCGLLSNYKADDQVFMATEMRVSFPLHFSFFLLFLFFFFHILTLLSFLLFICFLLLFLNYLAFILFLSSYYLLSSEV